MNGELHSQRDGLEDHFVQGLDVVEADGSQEMLGHYD